MPDPTDLSPLNSVDPAALNTLFAYDAATLQTLPDEEFMKLIIEARRRRNLFLAEEAAKATKAKTPRGKAAPSTTETALAADKPASEVDLEDLL